MDKFRKNIPIEEKNLTYLKRKLALTVYDQKPFDDWSFQEKDKFMEEYDNEFNNFAPKLNVIVEFLKGKKRKKDFPKKYGPLFFDLLNYLETSNIDRNLLKDLIERNEELYLESFDIIGKKLNARTIEELKRDEIETLSRLYMTLVPAVVYLMEKKGHTLLEIQR